MSSRSLSVTATMFRSMFRRSSLRGGRKNMATTEFDTPVPCLKQVRLGIFRSKQTEGVIVKTGRSNSHKRGVQRAPRCGRPTRRPRCISKWEHISAAVRFIHTFPLPTHSTAAHVHHIVSTSLKGGQFRRMGGGHSAEKLAFGHTTSPAQGADETPLTRRVRQVPTQYQRKQIPSSTVRQKGHREKRGDHADSEGCLTDGRAPS